jgi:hypothetical protein
MRTSFTTIFAVSGLIASVVATPAYFQRRQTDVCATGTPQCCDVDVLGIADLDCSTRKSSMIMLVSQYYISMERS